MRIPLVNLKYSSAFGQRFQRYNTNTSVLKLTTSSLVAVVGPTGSGKSALALKIARQFGGEIVNVDSVQVYRGLDIGSAKTRPDERGDIPHHLIDVVSPLEDFTAGAFAQLARACIAQISGLPILVGGTGFYLRSLLDGLSPAPLRNPELRHRLGHSPGLHRFLRRFDPAAAARIHSNDRQKLIRAVELAIAVPALAPRNPLAGYRILKIGLNPERADLYCRLNERSTAMFENGLVEETRDLLNAGVPANAKGLQSLGYKQAVEVLNSRLTRAQAMAEVQMKTRHYAKRQMTWFRREGEVRWLDGFGDEEWVGKAAELMVRDFVGG